MKKIIMFLLALALLIPACAMAEGSVELISVEEGLYGFVTVEFNNPLGNTSTIIWAQEDYLNTGSTLYADQVSGESSYTILNMVPGETYMVGVMNDFDTSTVDLGMYSQPVPGEFEDYGLRLYDANLAYFRPDSVQGDYRYNYATDLTASKIEDMLDDNRFVIKVDFRHNVYSDDITCIALTVVKSPTGHVTAENALMTIHEDSNGFWQVMADMNESFEQMIEKTGSIPSGKYEVAVYVDGELLDTDTFTVK